MRSLFIIFSLIILLFANCGKEVHRLRSISTQKSYRDVSRVVESILWDAKQAAFRGERTITYQPKPEDNTSEVCKRIRKIDRKFKIKRIGSDLEISW